MVMAEPQNLQTIGELEFSTGLEIMPRLAFRDEIQTAIEKWYGAAEQAEASVAEAISPEAEGTAIEFISSSSQQRNIEAMQEIQAELLGKSTPAVRLVASTITAAAAKQASDIHIEPQANDTVVRLRVDGMLRAGYDYCHIEAQAKRAITFSARAQRKDAR
jgi:type II secretory ATPase GspE/PulE/Tfp pilus assembly ATPase PilB-like protein